MVVRATMQGAHRSPASRGSLAATIGRLLVAGLAAIAIAMGRPVRVSADSGLASMPPPLHDGGSPDLGSEPASGPDTAPGFSTPRTIDTDGKAVRPEDLQQQGSVVAVFEDPTDPLIVIAVDHGYLTVRLRCGDRCPTIHRGDYVVAEGSGRSEAVFDAVDVWVVQP